MPQNQLCGRLIRHARGAICLLIAAGMALSLVGTLLLTEPQAALAAAATTTDNLNLRDGPSYQNKILTVMPAGSSLTVTGDPQNGFYPVNYQGRSGWALGTYLSIDGSPAPTGDGGSGSAVTTDRLNLRASPSLSGHILTVMPAGATVTLTGDSQNGFAAVSYNGQSGWAATAFLRTTSDANQSAAPAPSSDGWVTTTDLNLRAGPSTSQKILTVMPAGSAVTVTGAEQSGFYPVSYNGTSGWAYAAYLSQSGSQGQGQGSSQASSQSSASAGGSYTTQQIIDFIYAAADKYGQSRDDMLRVARCESNLNPRAVGGGSYGLFQFEKGTWASTPYASSDIFDPQANALAAGWMWSVGRRGEWVCQ